MLPRKRPFRLRDVDFGLMRMKMDNANS